MVAAISCYFVIGVVVGVVFSLLFINFDATWKKVVSSLLTFGGTGGIIPSLNEFFGIDQQAMKFCTVGALFLAFIFSFVIMMILMCKMLKDKDDNDVLRIRDILLGQKSYIDKYYEARRKEIDLRLDIPILEKRESAISQKEEQLFLREEFVRGEEEKIQELGKKKLKMILPEGKKIIVTDNFLKVLPSYIGDYSKCIHTIKLLSESFIETNKMTKPDMDGLNSYLLSIATCVSTYLFGSNNDVRVHFRYYNEEDTSFDKLVAVIGKDLVNQKMTSIPCDETSMIMKSFECKRCLIKSVNAEYDYKGNNYTKWKDYMTFAFYNLTRNGIPYLSFGISVKNDVRYRDLFYFLGYVEIENVLNEYVENVAQELGFEKILYGGKGE